jgi:hypothetical protein
MIGCGSTMSLSSSEKEKIDPQLQQLFTDIEINKKNYNISKKTDGEDLFGVIIYADNIDELTKLGYVITSHGDKIVTAKLSKNEIREVARLSSVKSIKNSTKNISN